jgi:D-serine deaminase-like pyridoxal phosphate-dependent protein
LASWDVFIPAFEVWGLVLSRPEPDLAIIGFGLRDVSSDQGFPRPQKVRKRETQEIRLAVDMEVVRLNDHHAYLRLAAEDDLVVGDQIGCGLSHPCTVFDKWHLIPVVDDEYNVVGVVQTFF